MRDPRFLNYDRFVRFVVRFSAYFVFFSIRLPLQANSCLRWLIGSESILHKLYNDSDD